MKLYNMTLALNLRNILRDSSLVAATALPPSSNKTNLFSIGIE